MNPARELIVFVRLNWRIIALCALVAVVAAAVMRSDRNRGRFVPSGVNGYPVLDTRTGQYCDPGVGINDVPKCADLAKSWR
jgi:hypothetical protein